MAADESRLGVDELAELGGVSRRTVRFYVQEQLLPPPLGVGRGRHYGREHLDALLKVKGLQEAGLTLEAIRRELKGPAVPATASRASMRVRSIWRRLSLAPGVELHVRGDLPLPPAAAVDSLLEWCRLHRGSMGETEHAEE